MNVQHGKIIGVEADKVIVKLESGSTIKAVKVGPLDKDPKKEQMEVKEGTAITVIGGTNGWWAIGSNAMGGSGGESQNKILIDLIAELKSAMTTISNAETDHGGPKPLMPSSVSAISTHASNLEAIKARLEKHKA